VRRILKSAPYSKIAPYLKSAPYFASANQHLKSRTPQEACKHPQQNIHPSKADQIADVLVDLGFPIPSSCNLQVMHHTSCTKSQGGLYLILRMRFVNMGAYVGCQETKVQARRGKDEAKSLIRYIFYVDR